MSTVLSSYEAANVVDAETPLTLKHDGLPVGIWMQRVPQSYHDTCYELRGARGNARLVLRFMVGALSQIDNLP